MKPFIVKKHQALVWSLAFSPDGMTLASGGADNNVVIWDVPTGEDLMTFKQNGTVEALRFSPDGRMLATAAHEPSRGSVCLWRAPADEDTPVEHASFQRQRGAQPAGQSRFRHGHAARAGRSYGGTAGPGCSVRSPGGRSGGADAFELFAHGGQSLRRGPGAGHVVSGIAKCSQLGSHRSLDAAADERIAVVQQRFSAAKQPCLQRRWAYGNRPSSGTQCRPRQRRPACPPDILRGYPQSSGPEIRMEARSASEISAHFFRMLRARVQLPLPATVRQG